MAQILLLHSAYGLRPAVHAAADRLREAGHQVHVPDLYDGKVFDTVEEGMAYREELGNDELLRRAVGAAAPLLGTPGTRLVYAGLLARRRAGPEPGARRRARARPAAPARHLGPARGRRHRGPGAAARRRARPVRDRGLAEHLVPGDAPSGAEVEVHRYRGAGHLFTDPELPDYDAEAAETAWAAALDFLTELDELAS